MFTFTSKSQFANVLLTPSIDDLVAIDAEPKIGVDEFKGFKKYNVRGYQDFELHIPELLQQLSRVAIGHSYGEGLHLKTTYDDKKGGGRKRTVHDDTVQLGVTFERSKRCKTQVAFDDFVKKAKRDIAKENFKQEALDRFTKHARYVAKTFNLRAADTLESTVRDLKLNEDYVTEATAENVDYQARRDHENTLSEQITALIETRAVVRHEADQILRDIVADQVISEDSSSIIADGVAKLRTQKRKGLPRVF